MVFKFPITDRTQNDVERYKELASKGWDNFSPSEKEEWLDGMKGALNAKDVNRVLNNIDIINKAMGLGLTIATVDSWYVDSAIFSQIEYALKRGYETTVEQPYNTYEKWNEIERITREAFKLLYDTGIVDKDVTAYRLAFRCGTEKGVFKP